MELGKLGKLGELLSMWWSSQNDGVQSLQVEIECRSCGKQGHIQAVCWKEHEKPAGAKFGGKGKPKSGEKGVAFTAHA
jgi:hypothetical protein